MPDPLQHRDANHAVHDLFVRRHSPRKFTGEAVSEADTLKLFEAARWAPSTYNEQEWRFCYARRDTEHWPTFLGLLVEANREWAKDTGLLAFVLSRTTFVKNGKPNLVHAFDAGAAVQNLALQATQMGLCAHAMGGIDRHGAIDQLNVPDGFDVHCAVAVGRPDPSDEATPTGRKPLDAIAREGLFTFSE